MFLPLLAAGASCGMHAAIGKANCEMLSSRGHLHPSNHTQQGATGGCSTLCALNQLSHQRNHLHHISWPLSCCSACPCLLSMLFVPPELRVVCNQERKSGKAPPKRLTTHQRQIVERLIAAHGDDLQVGPSRERGQQLVRARDRLP